MGEKSEHVDVLREVTTFVLGAATNSAKKMREVVDDLVNKGELTRQQGEKVLSGLEEKLSATRSEVERRSRDVVDRALGAAGLARKRTIDDLEARLAAIEARFGVDAASTERCCEGGSEAPSGEGACCGGGGDAR